MTGTRSQPSSLTLRAPSALASSGSSPTPGTRATTHRSTSASRSTWQVRSEGSLLPSNARSAGARPWSPRSVTSNEHRMGRNHLAGRAGDAANAVLAAVGYNFGLLLRWLALLLRIVLAVLAAPSHSNRTIVAS